jgi:hypothetical protein
LCQGGLQGFGFFGVQGFDGCVHGLSPEFGSDYYKYWMFVQYFLQGFCVPPRRRANPRRAQL